MLTMENPKVDMEHDISFYVTDGRLTDEPDGKKYDWGRMIEHFKKMGRPLTEEEAEIFRIN